MIRFFRHYFTGIAVANAVTYFSGRPATLVEVSIAASVAMAALVAEFIAWSASDDPR